MKDIAIEARDDATGAGQVVLRLKTTEQIETPQRYRLRLIDASDARWSDVEREPVSIARVSDGVDVTIGADIAAHPLLAPGTAVLLEFGGVRGEFLWPAVTPAPRAKRNRVALRIVPPAQIAAAADVSIDHAPATALLEFDRAARNMIPVVYPPTFSEARVELPTPTIVPPVAPHAAEPTPVAVVAFEPATPFTKPVETPKPDVSDAIPSIFSVEEWPRARDRPAAASVPVVPAHAKSAEDQAQSYARSQVQSQPDARRSVVADVPARDTAAIDPVAPPIERATTAAHAPEPAPETSALRDVTASVRATLNRMPALAAATLGFAVLTAVAGGVMLWPAGRGSATNGKGVAFQDQRRWQEGQLQKPAPVTAPTAVAAAATAPTGKSPAPSAPDMVPRPNAQIAQPVTKPPVVTASAAAPQVCGVAEAKTLALPAGVMSIAFRSTCHRQQAVTLSYGGLEFKRRFDIDGGLDVTIDCIFGASTPVIVGFADGKTSVVQPSCLDLERVSKIALIWRQPIDLDLHVFEKPAMAGNVGQITTTRPGARDASRALAASERAARGFLSSIGTAKSNDGADGVRITVYTAFLPPQATTQSVPFAVDFASRGDKAAGDSCVGGKYAGPGYEIVRLNARGQVTREDGQFAAFACGSTVAPSLRFNQTLHAPLRIRN